MDTINPKKDKSLYNRFLQTCRLRVFTFQFQGANYGSVFVPGRSRAVQKLNHNSHRKCDRKSPIVLVQSCRSGLLYYTYCPLTLLVVQCARRKTEEGVRRTDKVDMTHDLSMSETKRNDFEKGSIFTTHISFLSVK